MTHPNQMPDAFRAKLDAALARPVLLDPEHVHVVASAGAFRRSPSMDIIVKSMSVSAADAIPKPAPFTRSGDVAIVSIEGPLAQRAWSCWMFEGDGYDSILARVQAALAEKAVRAVVLRIDSPGGEAAGCFEAVRAIRSAATAADKPLVAYADEMMASAAYAIGCTADQIVTPDTGIVGSVGVICTIGDRVEQNRSDGLNLRVVRSGKMKAVPHPDEALTDAAVAHVQERIDAMAEVFAGIVAERRGMTPSKVLGLHGSIFLGADALKAGLADRVGNMNDAIALAREMAAQRTSGRIAAPSTNGARRMKTVIAALSLPEDATEADALAAVTRMQSDAKALMAATGKSDPAEALGAIEGFKARAAHADTLDEQLRVAREDAERKDRDDLLVKGKVDGKLTPALAAHFAAKSAAEIRSFLEIAPRVIPLGEEAREPAPRAIGGKTWGDMAPIEKDRLYREDRPAYDALKAEHERTLG